MPNRSQRRLRERDGVDSSGWDGQPIGGPPALLPPVIDSVNAVSVQGNESGGSSFVDALNLSGGPVDPALTQYLYTHFSSDDGVTVPVFPGGTWTAYTGIGGDDSMDWDTLGSENGPLNQPPAAGPYTGAAPYNVSFDIPTLDCGGGGRWKRLQITVANAAGSDSAFIFFQGDSF